MRATILQPAPRLSAVVAALAIVGLPALSACQKPETPAEAAPMHAVARGRIEVQGGLVAVTAPLEGELRALEVVEGQTVHKGDVLARFDDGAFADETRLIEAQANQSRQRQQAAQLKVRALSETLNRNQLAERAGVVSAQALADVQLSLADAQAEANRRIRLWGFQRYLFDVTCRFKAMGLRIGDAVMLTHPRYGLAAGRKGVVVKIAER